MSCRLVTIQRVTNTDRGLGNATRELTLNTWLNNWNKYCGKPNIIKTDPEGACRDQGFRRGLAVKSIRLDIDPGYASGKQECLGKHWIPSDIQQFVWYEELLAVSQFKKCWMSALLFTKSCIQIDRQASRFCENPDLAQCSVEVVDEAAKQRLRVKEESYKAYIEKELSCRKRRKEIHQTRPWRHWAASEWCWSWRSGKHKGSMMKGGAFLGPARVLLHERKRPLYAFV